MSSTTAPSEEQKPVSILYDHSQQLYNAMLAQAEEVEGENGPMMVYEGYLTRLVSDLHFSVPYYSKLRNHLIRMGCIVQLRRGGGSAPSKWELIREPDQQGFADAADLRRPGRDKFAALEQQIKDLNERVNVIEKALGLT